MPARDLPADGATVSALSVAFVADYFCAWMGGASLLGFLLNCVHKAAAAQNVRPYLLLDARMLPASLQREVIDFLPLARTQIDADGPLRALLESAGVEQVLFYRDFPRTLDLLQIDVVGPTGADLSGAAGGRPWFAYIPDFQHQHLPRYFTQQERFHRDRQFRALIENSAGVFVNSATVAADIERLYPAAARSTRVLRLPQLLPQVEYHGGAGFEAVLARHRVRPDYVLSCSQRWLHKRHDLIVEAFARIAHRYPELDLVFTGEVHDHRDPHHAERVAACIERHGLAARVRTLGMIGRDDQLALIDHARALVQASLFEGGPGASGMLEAALLGTPVVASDIAANRELTFATVQYFEAGSAEALAAALEGSLRRGCGERVPPFDAAQREVLSISAGIQFLAALRAAALAVTPVAA